MASPARLGAPAAADVRDTVAALVARARAAQRAYERYDQAQVDEVVVAAAWAIVEPARNRALAERAVADTGLGNVADKIAKNRRKTMGLLRDLHGRGRSASSPTILTAASSRLRGPSVSLRPSRRRRIPRRPPPTTSSTR